MFSRRRRIVVGVVLLASAGLIAALVLSSRRHSSNFSGAGDSVSIGPEGPGTDLFGDPLPEGALARIGTVRFRASSEITKAALSPDGKLLAVLANYGGLTLWNAPTGLQLRTIAMPEYDHRYPHSRGPEKRHESIEAMAFAADSRHINVMTTRGALRSCDVTNGTWSEPLAMTTWVQADPYGRLEAHSDVSPDGTHFTYTRYEEPSSRVEVFAVGEDKPIMQIEDPEFGTWGRRAKFSPDNKRIAIAMDNGTIKLWDLTNGRVKHTYYGPEATVLTFAFSADWKSLAATFIPYTRDRTFSQPITLVTWDTVSGKELYRAAKWEGAVVGYSGDGKRLIAATVPPGKHVLIADAASGKVTGQLVGHSAEGVWNYTMSRDGQRLVTLGQDHSIIIWDLATEKPLVDFEGPRGSIRALAFSPGGETVFAAGRGDQGCLWSAATGKLLHRLEVKGKEPATSAAFTPDGRHVVAGYEWGGTSTTANRPARMWSVTDGKLVREFPGHKGTVDYLAISPEGKELATMDRGVELVRHWELETGRQLREARFTKEQTARIAFPKAGDVVGIAPVAFSPGASRRQAEVYRSHILGGPPGGTWPNPGGSIQALSYCGGFVAMREKFGITSRREQIVIRVSGTGEVTKGLLIDREAELTAVAFSPNNEYVAVGSHRRDHKTGQTIEPKIHVFEMLSGREVRTLRGHRGGISALAFTPDGKKLATGSADSTVLIWDLTTPP